MVQPRTKDVSSAGLKHAGKKKREATAPSSRAGEVRTTPSSPQGLAFVPRLSEIGDMAADTCTRPRTHGQPPQASRCSMPRKRHRHSHRPQYKGRLARTTPVDIEKNLLQKRMQTKRAGIAGLLKPLGMQNSRGRKEQRTANSPCNGSWGISPAAGKTRLARKLH